MSVSRGDDRSTCISSCLNLVSISEPKDKFELTSNSIERLMIHTLYYRLNFMVPLVDSITHRKRKRSNAHSSQSKIDILENNIEIGDIVETLPEHEIRRNLNKKNELKGLRFMAEMGKYCGKQFRVLKKVSTIKIESTGEMRILRHPVYLLEGVYCDGEFHGGCERLCFLFWKTEWLKKV